MYACMYAYMLCMYVCMCIYVCEWECPKGYNMKEERSFLFTWHMRPHHFVTHSLLKYIGIYIKSTTYPFDQSIDLSIESATYPSINWPIYLSIYRIRYVPIDQSIHPSIHLSIHLSLYRSSYRIRYVPVDRSIYLYIDLSIESVM